MTALALSPLPRGPVRVLARIAWLRLRLLREDARDFVRELERDALQYYED